MKKFPLLVAVAMAVTLLCAPMAYAAPSPTEPDRPVEIGDSDVPLTGGSAEADDPGAPLTEIGDPDIPLSEELVEIDDPDVPLVDFPAPQTGVTGLSGMEALTLAAMAFAVSGAVILAKAGKQTCSVC